MQTPLSFASEADRSIIFSDKTFCPDNAEIIQFSDETKLGMVVSNGPKMTKLSFDR